MTTFEPVVSRRDTPP